MLVEIGDAADRVQHSERDLINYEREVPLLTCFVTQDGLDHFSEETGLCMSF